MLPHEPLPETISYTQADEIEHTLRTLFRPGDVVEIRSFKAGRYRTISGYYDDFHQAAIDAAALDEQCLSAGIYVTLNEVDPAFLGLYCNRLAYNAEVTTPDKGVVRRRYLPIDLDPRRGLTGVAGISATDEEMRCAINKAIAIRDALREREGWSTPIEATSGNGAHLLYPIDLPNSSQATEFVKTRLQQLGDEFDDEHVTVDRTVYNASRVVRLYGTTARKGDRTPTRLYRRSLLGAL